MEFEGGCYCGAIRYEVRGDPIFSAECHCRECQYITGGGPNFFIMFRPEELRYTAGEPAQYSRSDLAAPRTRDFCPTCGTHLVTRQPGGKTLVVKVGTMDEPALYPGPEAAIFLVDAQPFHCIAGGVPLHDRLPSR